MKNSFSSEFTAGLVSELQTYLALCEEILTLATRENQALSGQTDYQPFEFYQKRKNLLPTLESLLLRLRGSRMIWQQATPSEREHCREVKPLFQSIQSSLMKVLLLDRENQQAMLRRGLVPTRHLTTVVSQQPNYVASLYRRHSIV